MSLKKSVSLNKLGAKVSRTMVVLKNTYLIMFSFPPASSRSTFMNGFSLNRAARTAPADPAPTEEKRRKTN